MTKRISVRAYLTCALAVAPAFAGVQAGAQIPAMFNVLGGSILSTNDSSSIDPSLLDESSFNTDLEDAFFSDAVTVNDPDNALRGVGSGSAFNAGWLLGGIGTAAGVLGLVAGSGGTKTPAVKVASLSSSSVYASDPSAGDVSTIGRSVTGFGGGQPSGGIGLTGGAKAGSSTIVGTAATGIVLAPPVIVVGGSGSASVNSLQGSSSGGGVGGSNGSTGSIGSINSDIGGTPEPGTVGLLCGLGAVAGSLIRRRRALRKV